MNKEEVMRQRESTNRAKSAKKMRPATGKKKKWFTYSYKNITIS